MIKSKRIRIKIILPMVHEFKPWYLTVVSIIWDAIVGVTILK